MIVLLGSLALLFLALVVRRVHGRGVFDARRAQTDNVLRHVPLEGLTLSGDILERFALRGSHQGLELVCESHTFMKRPGRHDESEWCYRVAFRAPLEDMLVCGTSQVDAFMGPVPAVRPTRSGAPEFDGRYSVFVTPSDAVRDADFRTSPAAAALPWARPVVLRQFLDLGPTYFRAKDGRCELVGRPLHAGEVGATLALCVNLARASLGNAPLEAPPVQPRAPRITTLVPGGAVAGVGECSGAIRGRSSDIPARRPRSGASV